MPLALFFGLHGLSDLLRHFRDEGENCKFYQRVFVLLKNSTRGHFRVVAMGCCVTAAVEVHTFSWSNFLRLSQRLSGSRSTNFYANQQQKNPSPQDAEKNQARGVGIGATSAQKEGEQVRC